MPGTISVYRFHGPGKAIDLAQLLQHDVVLTTYASIAADFCRGRSTLHRIEWYRVVLDEGIKHPHIRASTTLNQSAHFVRNSATQQFRAIHAIPSKLRWCLTGTPIQNSLEDLGALVKFLKVPILEDLAIFRKQITIPVIANVSGRFKNLRQLLEAVCLRRTKALLNLPEPITHTEYIQLSANETIKYRDFGELCKQAINVAVSGHSMKRANQHVIQAILGMRLFCNDGDNALAKRVNAYGLPSDPGEALSYLQTSEASACARCGTDITTMYQKDDKSSGILTVCQHLICGECISEYEGDLDDSLEDGRAKCPECELRGERNSFILRAGAATTRHTAVKNGKYPTKLLALLENVQSQSINDKCIVFSFWKTTLDIVAQMFDTHTMAYCRIHGQISATKRSKILTDFEKLGSARILLITLGTGAVGLNKLKVANHIHILEPQWNPSVESQAIGRVLRLGQEKSVKIIRYIMKGTVEEVGCAISPVTQITACARRVRAGQRSAHLAKS
ncbi:DNA repair protein rad5 [Ophiobolus disseminans]|uniref:DNA repair protein rad5 n=1 Tax=Ophiobolus disseminans TaxID=1469910 RepID=A0A6A7AAU9_9PLEO|nr:DNA repair protein rad5 [Ophiobolus disseminans]